LPTGLIPLERRFRSLFERAAAAPADSVYIRAARLIERLLAEPREVRVLHGDMHHYNVRWHPDRGWLAFDPKGLVGERTYDAANTLCNPNELPSLVHDEGRLLNNARILAQAMQMDLPRVLAFTYAYTALSASWSLDIDNDPTYALRVGQLIEPHLTE
jgi:streptomycin 6-kinase